MFIKFFSLIYAISFFSVNLCFALTEPLSLTEFNKKSLAGHTRNFSGILDLFKAVDNGRFIEILNHYNKNRSDREPEPFIVENAEWAFVSQKANQSGRESANFNSYEFHGYQEIAGRGIMCVVVIDTNPHGNDGRLSH